jgi:hypothetical protein
MVSVSQYLKKSFGEKEHSSPSWTLIQVDILRQAITTIQRYNQRKMKRFLIPLVAFWLLTDIISTVSSAAIDTDSSGDSILDGSMDDLNARFQLWQVEYKKDYKTAKELAERLEIWIQNHCKFRNYCVYHTYGQ